MPVDINELSEGWLELESDPGLFTLLLEDFGVKGVQVEEIYDLQKSLEGPVYGFIFLFRWIEERRSRRKIVDETDSFVRDEEAVNNIFFAQQMVPNSCATHALLSVLINCPSLNLGATVSRLKAHTSGMSPENKGWAIGNTPELARAHNSHAMPQAKRRHDKSSSFSTGRYTGEAFHFVSYVPIEGRLFELDGLKPYPIDHGPWGEKEDWTEKFRRVITDRLGMSNGEQYHDICFNLMAVVPDRRLALNHKLKLLRTNRQIVLEALQQLVSLSSQGKLKLDHHSDDTEIKIKDKNSTVMLQAKNVSTDKVNKDSKEKPAISNEESKDKIIMAKPTTSPSTSSKNNANEEWETERDSNTDYSTPLTIQTSPAPSGGSSTDTSSEVGSAFNSPTQGWSAHSGQSSPTSSKDFKKFVVIRVAGEDDKGKDKCDTPARPGVSKRSVGDVATTSSAVTPPSKKQVIENSSGVADSAINDSTISTSNEIFTTKVEPPLLDPSSIFRETDDKKVDPKLFLKYPELFESQHTFAPKDLLALLKNLENEINICESNVRDENEKRRKYKVDDCRRTHNYDEFICTFLSMLAQQGKLADLVQQHLHHHKRQGNPNARLHRSGKKADARTAGRSRRGRNKHRRRK